MRDDNRRTEGVVATEMPLFASSWVALFTLLRRNWRHDGPSKRPATISPKTGPNPRPQSH
jgi:hypothetical protein